MKHSITQAYAWLHTWAGLVFGWALVAIFLTGTWAVFDKEISNWMQPEVPAQDVPRAQSVATAIDYLSKHHPHESNWQVGLPTERNPKLAVGAGEPQGGGRRGGNLTTLDPATGEVLNPRQTAGGNFFFRFHYTLHFPRNIGVWVVGFMAMAMLAAIVTGIVIHKKFFKEFFTFRPNKGQRSWLDYHNASGVLLLPFHIMITYTGLVIFFLIYMPAPMDALFDGDRQAYQAALRAPQNAQGASREMAEHPREGREAPREQGHGAERGAGGRMPRVAEIITFDRTADIDFMGLINKAEAELGPISGFSLVRRNDGNATFEARPIMGNIIELTKGRSVALDALTGTIVRSVPESSGAGWVQRVMAGLHFAQFGGYPMRWLYFICGLISTAMMAGGLVLFCVKRRKRYAKESLFAQRGYALIERINIAVISGLLLASIGMLWANRLLPVEMSARAAAEINVFFILWGASFLHASLRPVMNAWVEQLIAVGALALLLPALNFLGGNWVLSSSAIWLELTSVVLGGLSLAAAWHVSRPSKVVTKKARPTKTQAKEELAC